MAECSGVKEEEMGDLETDEGAGTWTLFLLLLGAGVAVRLYAYFACFARISSKLISSPCRAVSS